MKRAVREALAVRIRKVQGEILSEGFTVSYDEVASRMKLSVGMTARLCRKYAPTGDQADAILPDERPHRPEPTMTPEQSAKFRALIQAQVDENKRQKEEKDEPQGR